MPITFLARIPTSGPLTAWLLFRKSFILQKLLLEITSMNIKFVRFAAYWIVFGYATSCPTNYSFGQTLAPSGYTPSGNGLKADVSGTQLRSKLLNAQRSDRSIAGFFSDDVRFPKLDLNHSKIRLSKEGAVKLLQEARKIRELWEKQQAAFEPFVLGKVKPEDPALVDFLRTSGVECEQQEKKSAAILKEELDPFEREMICKHMLSKSFNAIASPVVLDVLEVSEKRSARIVQLVESARTELQSALARKLPKEELLPTMKLITSRLTCQVLGNFDDSQLARVVKFMGAKEGIPEDFLSKMADADRNLFETERRRQD